MRASTILVLDVDPVVIRATMVDLSKAQVVAPYGGFDLRVYVSKPYAQVHLTLIDPLGRQTPVGYTPIDAKRFSVLIPSTELVAGTNQLVIQAWDGAGNVGKLSYPLRVIRPAAFETEVIVSAPFVTDVWVSAR